MEVSIIEYCKRFGIDIKQITRRYVQILKMMHCFIAEHDFDKTVTVNGRMLQQAIIDYFVDSSRIKEFHNIKNTNKEKIYAYIAYWLLRRKPLQIISSFNGCEFVNEIFVTALLSSGICVEKKIGDDEKKNNPTFGKFQDLLFYNLKYRPVTQQSLELMIEAFFCGCDFVTED